MPAGAYQILDTLRFQVQTVESFRRKQSFNVNPMIKFSVTIALLSTLLLVGCGPKNPPQTAASGQKILRLGNGSEPQDLDPQTVTGVTEHHIIMALFEGLLSEDPKDLHPVPGLAESWTISDDGLVYTFNLRPNAKWSNGEAITADALVLSYKRMLSPKLAAEYAYLIFNFVAGAEDYYRGRVTDFTKVGFKATDAHTLQVTLKNPTPYLLKVIASHIAWNPVPVNVIAQFGAVDEKRTSWTRPGNIVGNGPFILKEWLPNQKILVVRNPHYWDAATVKLDGIEFYATEDISSEERTFRTGQIHKTNELPNSKIDTYRKEYPESLRIEPYLGIYYYRCNVTRPPLNDKRVRKALALALDRESLIRNVVKGGQEPAYAVSYPGTAGYTPQARLTGDLAEAKRLLAEAGYPDGKGCPPIELLYNTSENHRAIAEAVQAMWRTNLGVDLTIRNAEWKVYLDAQHTQNYQMQRAGWIADYVDPHVFLEVWQTGNGNNDTLWSNAEYDQLLQQALAAKTETERYALYQKMDAILVDEVPVIPIYYYKRVYALSPKVIGWHPTLLDNHPYKHVDLLP